MLYVVCRSGYRMAAIELLTVVLLSLVTCRQSNGQGQKWLLCR